jgi:hypothetical protein
MTKFFKLTKLDNSIAFIPADRLLRIESEPNNFQVSLLFEEGLRVRIGAQTAFITIQGFATPDSKNGLQRSLNSRPSVGSTAAREVILNALNGSFQITTFIFLDCSPVL